MTFTEWIEPEASEIWDAILEHPVVEELGEGTLDEEPFRYWLRQDYVYLIEYNRLFALGAAKAPTLEQMETMADLLESAIHHEMDLHRSYAASFDVSEAELEATTPSPTTRAYTDFLIRTASMGTFGDITAVLLPCMWGFNKTGKRLEKRGIPDHEHYAQWIEMYSGEEFTEVTEWCKDLMNELAADATEAQRERYRELFLTSARYEYRFWDAAWRQEEWSV